MDFELPTKYGHNIFVVASMKKLLLFALVLCALIVGVGWLDYVVFDNASWIHYSIASAWEISIAIMWFFIGVKYQEWKVTV